jgi:hypothetical protein
MFWKKKRKKKQISEEDERRREPRHLDANEIILQCRKDPGLKVEAGVYRAWTKNASPSGLKVECDFTFPLGTVFDIQIFSPKRRKQVHAAGRVIWTARLKQSKSYEMGLEFVETSVDTILEIVDHIYRM